MARPLLVIIAAALALVGVIVASPQPAQAVTGTGSISGTISLGSTGHPAGSNVGIAYTMWSPTYVSTRFWGYTDSSGAFTITGLAAGTYVVQVQSGNIRPYQDEYTVATAAGGLSPVQPASGQVTVADGQPTNVGELILTKARTISGMVTVDGAPASSNVQSTEVLLELDYQVPGSSTWTFAGLGYTDAVGHYSIDSVPRETGDLPIGRYRIFAQGAIVPAYVSVTQEFDVLPATANFDLPFGADVTGLVWAGKGVDWNEVSITLTSGSRTMTSNVVAGGTFDIRLVPRGTWTLTAAYLSGNGTPFTTTFSVVNANVVIPQINLTPMPTIQGVLTGADTGYLDGMTVNAFEYDLVTGAYVRTISTTTTGSGFYRFMDVVPASYAVESSDPSHHFATMDYLNESPYYAPDYIDATNPFPYEADFVMPIAAHVTGTVHGPTPAEFAAGNITAEVEVQDYSSGSPIWTETGDVWPVSASGSYDVGDLPPDSYRLKFASGGTAIYPPVTSPTVTVAEGQTKNVDVTLVKAASGSFGSLAPARLLDTRIGDGASGAIPAHGVLSLQVTGRGGVPASGVSSVVLNVTVAGSTAAGFVTAYGDGALPVASNLNFVAGQIVPNLVVVPVGADGRVNLYNGSSAPIQLVADVSGYYVTGASTSPGSFGSLPPSRLLDSRIAVGAPGAVSAHGVLSLQVTGRGGVPASGVSSVVLNVTVAGSSAAGFVTAYPDGTTLPIASNLNFVAGQDVPNLVVVPVGADGKVNLYNGSSAPIQLVADVSGYYRSGLPVLPGSFGSLAPSRLLDSRISVGAPGAVAGHGVLSLQVTGRGGVPASGVSSVVLNVTVAGSSAAGFVTAYPSGTALPIASNLNFVARQDVPNLVVVPVGADGKVNLYNGSPAAIQLVADVSGYYLSGVP